MNKAILPLISATAGLLTLGIALVAWSGSGGQPASCGGWVRSRADISPVTEPVYDEECGSCHMAYQPGLLAADAWAQILEPEALADHYGDDASLADEPRDQIRAYLTANAADQSKRRRARAFAVRGDASALAAGLPRITESPYFVGKHLEIPARWVDGNPDVGSFAQCNACHRGAETGVFNEHQVVIPGVGCWKD